MKLESRTFKTPDGAAAAWVWPGDGARRLLFAHANGFNAFTYQRMLSALNALTGVEIVAVDLRGHGSTTLPADPEHHRGWDVYARDLSHLMDQLDDVPLTLAGHSMGAASLILAAAARGSDHRILAIEPVLLPRIIYALARTPLHPAVRARNPLYKGALTRFDGFDSRDAALRRYREKPTFARWASGVVEDYLRDGLVQRGEAWRLACTPAWEAANFGEQQHAMWRALDAAGSHVHVLKAGLRSTVFRPESTRLKVAFMETWPEAGHLLPMEQPEAVARWLADRMLARA